MTFDKFTIKAQEAVQAAVNTAQRNGQQTIEPVHLLSGIIEKAPDVTNYIFQKLGMNGNQIAMLLQQEMQHLPRVQGAGQPKSSWAMWAAPGWRSWCSRWRCFVFRPVG